MQIEGLPPRPARIVNTGSDNLDEAAGWANRQREGSGMTASSVKPLPTIGFLTVCDQADRGILGGYLILNTAGRPLEFHCTAPVRPTRAQEILYGPTLRPFLFGEQIGRTLVAKATSEPLFVCTDVEPVLALRDCSPVPVVLVRSVPAEDAALHGAAAALNPTLRLDAAHPTPPPAKRETLVWFALGERAVAVAQAHAEDREPIHRDWQSQLEGLDLSEPFTRIREALEEAQRTPGRG